MAQDVQTMLATIPDYIATKRYGNSISALETRYPEGAPPHIIAQALDITEEEVEVRYQKIIACIRTSMRVC
jgi:hypothetical protein